MNMNKDYYAILGVLPSAEHAVIKAAWRALSMMYHPDKYDGDSDFANEQMRRINEAAEVLLDSKLRSQYDQIRSAKVKSRYDDDNQNHQYTDSSDDSVSPQWKVAVEHFPDLNDIVKHLNRTSRVLGCSFQSTLLETKQFAKRFELAAELEQSFIEAYFGKDKTLQKFARFLIRHGNRAAAKHLNEAINVIGDDTESLLLIAQVCKKFSIDYETEKQDKKKSKNFSTLNWLLIGIGLVLIILGLVYEKEPLTTLPVSEPRVIQKSSVKEPLTNTPNKIDNTQAISVPTKHTDNENNDTHWALQLATFKDERNAKSLVSDLKKSGFSSYYKLENGFVRVYVGPGTKMQLDKLKAQIRDYYSLDGMLVKTTPN